MRFRFCGDLDAPDWLLSEVTTLSKISSIRMKILVKQVVAHLLEGQMDYEKVLKMTKEALPETADLQGAIAAINFIISNAAKYDVDEQTLLQEIQQLGMPKENSVALARPYQEAKQELRDRFARSVYQLSKLRCCAWRVEQPSVSSTKGNSSEPSVALQLLVDERPHAEEAAAGSLSRLTNIGIQIPADKFHVLYKELTEVSEGLTALKRG